GSRTSWTRWPAATAGASSPPAPTGWASTWSATSSECAGPAGADDTLLCPESKGKRRGSPVRMPPPARLSPYGTITAPLTGKEGTLMFAMIVLIVLMIVAVAAMELIMRSSSDDEEGV